MKVFEDQNGQFACSPSKTEGEIRSALNLYRAPLIAFPGEKVMEEAQIFSSAYLKEALQNIPVSRLSREVGSTHIFLTFVCFTMWCCYICVLLFQSSGLQIGDVVEYGWHTNFPRWEVRNYMDVFEQDFHPSFNKNKYGYSRYIFIALKISFNSCASV